MIQKCDADMKCVYWIMECLRPNSSTECYKLHILLFYSMWDAPNVAMMWCLNMSTDCRLDKVCLKNPSRSLIVENISIWMSLI